MVKGQSRRGCSSRRQVSEQLLRTIEATGIPARQKSNTDWIARQLVREIRRLRRRVK